MLALSVKQPWAELIARGTKREEYRSRPIKHRGDLLIVSSRAYDDKAPAYAAWPDLPCGVAVCVVTVTGCRETADGYAWILENPRRVEPVAVKGSAAFYHVADDSIRFTLLGTPAADDRSSARAREARPAAPPLRRTSGGPYSLHHGRRTLARGVATMAEARTLAKGHAADLHAYVVIERDGYQVSGEGPAEDPVLEPEEGERFTFALGGQAVPGSEATAKEARITARFLVGFYHGAPVTILRDGRPVETVRRDP